MHSANTPIYFDDADRLTEALIRRIGKNIVLALPLGLGKADHVAISFSIAPQTIRRWRCEFLCIDARETAPQAGS